MLKQQIRDLLLEDTPEQDLELWFDPLLLSRTEDNRLQIEFPHLLFQDWFQASFKKRFEAGLARLPVAGLPVYSAKNIHRQQTSFFLEFSTNKPAEASYPENGYSFENFLHNAKNQFPVAAAKNFSRLSEPGLFTIYSENGCGKTHLLASIYNEINLFVHKNSIFFGKLSDLETIIENNYKQGHSFFQPFSEKKVLLIDNFQDCGGRIETQKNLIRLLEFCSEQKISLCVTLDAPPAKWAFMEKRLRSMLESGLVIEIKKPDLDVKTRYIQEKSDEFSLKLKKNDILKLARMYNEFRQIQGAILKILSFSEYAQTNNKKTDLDVILKNSQTGLTSPLSPKLVLDCVAEAMQLAPEQILGKGRQHHTAQARHLVMYLLREMLAAPLAAIGKFMDKDHSSVLYSINKIQELSKTNKDMNKTVSNLKQLCLNKARQI